MIASVHAPGTRTDAASIHSPGGRYIAPGFIDTHVHLESSHMLPHHYAAPVVPQGTTTVFWDPHELANVMGAEVVRYATAAMRDRLLRCLIHAPSSVPCAPALEAYRTRFDLPELHK